jgi:uncharacterized protein (TIGR01777 family)
VLEGTEFTPVGDPAGRAEVRLDRDGTAVTLSGWVEATLASECNAARLSPDKTGRFLACRPAAGAAVMDALRQAAVLPAVLVQASAVGYYGARGAESVSEDAPPGTNFLAQVAERWEASTLEAEALGVRRVVVRTSMVLGRGGALAKMLPPFRLGLGGPLGSGRQMVPWIHLDDEAGAIAFLLQTPGLSGPFNLAAPEAVDSRAFARALGRALGRPAFLPAPGFVLRLLLGQMAEEVLLSGVRSEPTRLLAAGYRFKHPGLAVIALGKFGGQELGYGADLDVLFVSERDGVEGIKQATDLMAFMERQTPTGVLFKVDPRLRPDGEKGPLACSLAAHQEYYRQRAQLWERQALTKARFVAGDERLGREFMELVQRHGYAQPLTVAEWQQIRHMRQRVETERGDARQREWEFKTGPGGLMDVEFLVQALQLAHGGRHPQLRTAHTLAALNRLTALGLVDDEPGYHLRQGYLFLRRVELVLRRLQNTSVSKLPADPRDQTTLAKRLGFATAKDFLANYRLVTVKNRKFYNALMNG